MQNNNLRIAVVSMLAARGIVSSAEAANSAGPETYTDLQEVVIVANKVAMPYAEVAATVSTIDVEAIEASAANSLRDVLQYMPGIDLRRDPSRFGYDSISIRGVGGNRVAVLIDGAPAAKGFTIGAYSDSGRSLPELDSVQRIEILRGPASALYGSDAIGGVVSIATLAPSDLLRDSVDNWAVQLRGGYRGDVDELRAGVDFAFDARAVDALIGFTHRNAGDIGTTGTLPPNPRDATGDALTAKLVWDEAPGGRMRLMGSALQSRTKTDIDSLELTPPRFINTTYLFGDDCNEVYDVVLDQSLDFTTLGGEWRVYWSQTHVEQESDEERRAVPGRSAPLHIDRTFDMRTDVVGGELTLSHRVAGERVEQRWVYGIAGSYSNIAEFRDGMQTNLTTGAPTNTILGEVMPVRDFPISELVEAGVYVQDDVRITERWSMIPAVRFDYYDLSPEPDVIYLQDNPTQPAVSVRQQSVSPKLGVVYRFAESASVFAQYEHGFRAQPVEDVNVGFNIATFNYRGIPNPDLRSEKSDGYELGFRIEGDWIRASLSGFYTDYDDFIASRQNIGADPNDPMAILFQSRNIAEAVIYGLEFDAHVQLDVFSDALRGISIAMSAIASKGEDRVNATSLNAVNPAEAAFKLAYESASRIWSGDLITRVVDAKDDVVTPPGALVPLAEVGGYTILDAFFHLRLTEQLRLDVGVTNALDREYQVWSDVRERPVNDPELPLYYQPGRSWAMALKWLL